MNEGCQTRPTPVPPARPEQKDTATDANSRGIIKKQIELLEQVNQKLLAELTCRPTGVNTYLNIRENSLAIASLVNQLEGQSKQSTISKHEIAVSCAEKIDDVFRRFLHPNMKRLK